MHAPAFQQKGNYILIPNLGIGGGIIEKNDNLLLLDNGFVIVKPNATNTFHTCFFNISRNYVKHTTSSVQRDLAEGPISIALMHEADTLSIIAAQNCHANK